jgi:hypothetical protein
MYSIWDYKTYKFKFFSNLETKVCGNWEPENYQREYIELEAIVKNTSAYFNVKNTLKTFLKVRNCRGINK